MTASAAKWSTQRDRFAALWRGIQAASTAILPTSTWALVTGVAMVKSGLTEVMAVTMTLLVYAGSAQLTSLPLIASGAPLWLIFIAGFIVNLRFVIFSAILQPYFHQISWPKRLALGYFTTDMAFVVFIPRFGEVPIRGTREQLWFFIGAIGLGWFVWQISAIVGIYLGALVPASWSLDFAAMLALLAIGISLIKNTPMLVSVLAAGFVAWIGQMLPLRAGLAAAVLAGILAGICAERYLKGNA